jgi:cytochrome bd-type quinol oxidase subunit 2
VFWTAYPAALGSIASTLAVPLFLAGLGIVLRGAAYALRSGASGAREHLLIDNVFARSSVFTPFALGTMAGAIATGRVLVGNDAGGHFSSWLGLTPVLDGVIAVASSAYAGARAQRRLRARRSFEHVCWRRRSAVLSAHAVLARGLRTVLRHRRGTALHHPGHLQADRSSVPACT